MTHTTKKSKYYLVARTEYNVSIMNCLTSKLKKTFITIGAAKGAQKAMKIYALACISIMLNTETYIFLYLTLTIMMKKVNSSRKPNN